MRSAPLLCMLMGTACGFTASPTRWPEAAGLLQRSHLGGLRGRPCPALRPYTRVAVRACEGGAENLVAKANAALSDGSAFSLPAPVRLFKALRKATKTLSLAVEFHRDEMLVHTDVYGFSSACREAKCVAIAVRTDVEDGDLDMKSFVQEQRKAQGKFPGPCVLIHGQAVTSVEEIAAAAAAGANGVFVRARAEDAAQAKSLVAASHAMGLEAIAEVWDKEGVQCAIDCGCKIVCVRDIDGLSEALDLCQHIPDDLARMVAVPAMQKECSEVAQCEMLHAAGYHGVLLEEAGKDVETDYEYVSWAASTIGGKKSAAFSFNVNTGAVEEKREDRWSRESRERDPVEWGKWQKYRKSRDYQIRATIWRGQ